MITAIYRSIVVTLALAVLLCVIYPLAVMGVGKLLFNEKSNGSLILGKDGKPVGSRLIGQVFSKPEYFHGRPSAAGSGYDGAASSGSNLGPTNQKLADNVKANMEGVLKENPGLQPGQVPVDMVTTSASGLDPHISPENAFAQAGRVAAARKLPMDQVTKLIEETVEGPQWGIFGEAVVNVLALNLALDQLTGK
jgi:K+-transporting ATPase ATPase C chain